LKLSHKGIIRAGADADLLLTDDKFRIRAVFAKGQLMVQDGAPIVFGVFENSEGVPGSPGGPGATGIVDRQRGRTMIEPDDDDPDDFPDRRERQRRSRRHCC
ncbi:MAG: beta-aspartyl-peptidase, partial [Firmicutes bacterium]|nr:beta-aspartyl-peptidase [Bacillota bacterium]